MDASDRLPLRLPLAYLGAAAACVLVLPLLLAWKPAPRHLPAVGPDWGAVQTGLAAAHLRTTGSPRVVIAVVDTGVDPSALAGRLVPGATFVGDGRPDDLDGHGTQVAKIAASACPRCSIMPVRVLGPGGRGSYDAIAAGVLWAAAHGARVVNLSLTTDRWNAAVTDAVEAAERLGALVVAAAGNAGSSSPAYPAASAGVLAVAGSNPGGGRAAESNFGPWVALAAPACAPDGPVWFCGTSAATPYVSGAAGLYLSRYPRAGAVVAATALRLSALPVGYAAGGLLRADAALRLAPALLLRGGAA